MLGIVGSKWPLMLAAVALCAGCAGTRTTRDVDSGATTAPAAAAPAPAPAPAPATAATVAAAPSEAPPPAPSPVEPAAPAPVPAAAPVKQTPPPAAIAEKPVTKPAPAATVATAKPPPKAEPKAETPLVADPVAEGTERLSGRIALNAAPGQQVAAGETANAVVYYVPARGAPRPKAGRYSIITLNKRFDPQVIVVPAGSTVSFPNQDEILHNVFSTTPGMNFDLGLYGEGQSAETVFNRAVVVQIFCNVHHSMNTNVVVAPTPWFARVGSDGSFALEGLPAGAGTLSLWHPRVGMVTREVTLPLAAPLQETLLATKPVIPEHARKDGASYRPAAR